MKKKNELNADLIEILFSENTAKIVSETMLFLSDFHNGIVQQYYDGNTSLSEKDEEQSNLLLKEKFYEALKTKKVSNKIEELSQKCKKIKGKSTIEELIGTSDLKENINKKTSKKERLMMSYSFISGMIKKHEEKPLLLAPTIIGFIPVLDEYIKEEAACSE